MAVNPVGANADLSVLQRNVEIKKRDLTEEAATKSKEVESDKERRALQDMRSRNETKQEGIRVDENENRRKQSDEEQVTRIRDEVMKRQNQDRRNPNAGNIINVIA